VTIVRSSRIRARRTASPESKSDPPYYRARYYDPQIGRFISEDPIGVRGGINFYVYAANSPVDFVDPLGLAPTCVMTASGLVCQNPDPVKDRVDSLQALFPSAKKTGDTTLIITMSCERVKETLINGGYHTGSFFSTGNWVSQNPFLFSNPINHRGGSEFRDRFGFHLRMKRPTCDKECQTDQFHIDSANPLYDPWGHFVNDFIPAIGNKIKSLF
jgi:RHS repeat-associated protein